MAWCDSEWGISLWHGVIQSGRSHCGIVYFRVGDLTVAWCDSEWEISLWHGVIQSGGSHCLTLAWCV